MLIPSARFLKQLNTALRRINPLNPSSVIAAMQGNTPLEKYYALGSFLGRDRMKLGEALSFALSVTGGAAILGARFFLPMSPFAAIPIFLSVIAVLTFSVLILSLYQRQNNLLIKQGLFLALTEQERQTISQNEIAYYRSIRLKGIVGAILLTGAALSIGLLLPLTVWTTFGLGAIGIFTLSILFMTVFLNEAAVRNPELETPETRTQVSAILFPASAPQPTVAAAMSLHTGGEPVTRVMTGALQPQAAATHEGGEAPRAVTETTGLLAVA